MKSYDAMNDAERAAELLKMLVSKALTGDRRARRYVGELLGIKGRRVPSVDEIRRAAVAD